MRRLPRKEREREKCFVKGLYFSRLFSCIEEEEGCPRGPSLPPPVLLLFFLPRKKYPAEVEEEEEKEEEEEEERAIILPVLLLLLPLPPPLAFLVAPDSPKPEGKKMTTMTS